MVAEKGRGIGVMKVWLLYVRRVETFSDLEAKKTYTIFATQISKHGVVVQLVRIPACHAGGRGFESRPYRQRREHSESCALFLYRYLSHLDNLRCHLLQIYSSLLLSLRDVWDGVFDGITS